MGSLLTSPDPDPVAAFRDRGVALLGRVLDDADLERVRDAIDRLAPEHAVNGGYAGIIHDPWRKDAAFSELVAPLSAFGPRRRSPGSRRPSYWPGRRRWSGAASAAMSACRCG